MALISDRDYKLALKARMRVLAKRSAARTEIEGFIERNDILLVERDLIKRIARLNQINLPVRDEE